MSAVPTAVAIAAVTAVGVGLNLTRGHRPKSELRPSALLAGVGPLLSGMGALMLFRPSVPGDDSATVFVAGAITLTVGLLLTVGCWFWRTSFDDDGVHLERFLRPTRHFSWDRVAAIHLNGAGHGAYLVLRPKKEILVPDGRALDNLVALARANSVAVFEPKSI